MPNTSHPNHLDAAQFLTPETHGLYEPDAPAVLGQSAERSSKHNRQVAEGIPHWQRWREQPTR